MKLIAKELTLYVWIIIKIKQLIICHMAWYILFTCLLKLMLLIQLNINGGLDIKIQIQLIFVVQVQLMNDNRDKEVIKNIQAKAQIINKVQDKASKVLVLSMGSYTIKMGFANEKVPFTIKPYIAYKKLNNKQSNQQINFMQEQAKQQDFDNALFKKQYNEIETYLKNQGVISSEHRPVKGKPRGKQMIPLVGYPQVGTNRQVLYSQDALAVEDCTNEYVFRKPFRHGQFNVKNDSQEQIQNCLNDIQRLLKFMLKQKMKIPQKQWRTFSCIVSIPDVFIRKHVKNLVSMIFSKIGFNKIYMHLESVLACLGTAISSAAVVDIGHEKISVCCVDEGVILPKTLVRKNYGLKHISKTMIKLFNNKINQQGYNLSVSSQADQYQVDQIKQLSICIKEPEQNSNKVYQLKTVRGRKPVQIAINYSDVMCISANSIFFNIWNSFSFGHLYQDAFNSYSDLYDLQYDSEDLFQQYSGGGHFFEIQQDNPYYSKQLINPFIYQPLQQLVAASINSIKDAQIRKKFLTSILVIGGGGLVPQLSQQLLVKINKIFQSSQSQEKAESPTDLLSKQIDLTHASWLGGTVLPKLDSLRDLWIERNKYMGTMKVESVEIEEEGMPDKRLFTRKEESQEWGIRYLKQKIPFLW